jgi:23S rRNA (guanosine2251-2'-O)-methyltransferase
MRQTYGIHPVLETLKHHPRAIHKIYIKNDRQSGLIQEIVELARQHDIVLEYKDRAALDSQAHQKNHQGVIAVLDDFQYTIIEDFLEKFAQRLDSRYGLILILDGLTDPHNLGAVIRSASAAKVDAIIIPKDNSVDITETVAKASAGAIEHIPVIKITNIARTIDQLKDQGFWIIGAQSGDVPSIYGQKYDRHFALIIGSEGKGLRELTKKKCDLLLAIPLPGPMASLNASCAASVIIFEIQRQRGYLERA